MIVSDGNREYWECFGWRVVKEYRTKSGNRYFIMEPPKLDEQEGLGAREDEITELKGEENDL